MKKRIDLSSGSNAENGANETTPGINPYNGAPLTKRYYDILEKRKTLPVWEQREEFHKMFASTQIMILQGETGSGKTTQVRNRLALKASFCLLVREATIRALNGCRIESKAFALPSHF